jgi:ribosomal protein L11 methyltransferase
MTDPAWRKLSFHARDTEVELIEAVLEEAGALAITIEARDDVPVFDTLDQAVTLWPQCRIEALFDRQVDPEDILARVSAAGFSTTGVSAGWVADQAWHLTWRDQFQPRCFAERLWIVPSWHTPPPAAELVINLDPGMAFGTGTHPTTSLCLEWLITDADVPRRRVLDYGCGSGILAIAAAKLGAHRVAAVDIDPEACRVARENAAQNACSAIAIGTPAGLPAEPFEILIANLLLRPVLELRTEFAARLVPGGRIALSGIMEDQVPAVLEAYAEAFKMEPPRFNGEWALVAGIRR